MTGVSATQHLARQALEPRSFRGNSIDMYVNAQCNLRCSTCFLGEEYFATGLIMERATAAAIAGWARTGGVKEIAILGGEPSIHPDIEHIISDARALGIQAIRLVTNGTRPFQRLLKSAAGQLIDVFYVSLDGATAATNDAIRGASVFAQALRTIEMLAANGRRFIITSSVTTSTIDEFDELMALAETSGCERLNIHWTSPTGRASDSREVVNGRAWLKYCERAMAYEPQRPDFIVQCQPAFRELTRDNSQASVATQCAVRETSNLQFMPNGAVYSCGLVVDRPGLNGYERAGGKVLYADSHAGATELQLCATETSGCPVRAGALSELVAGDEDLVPLCIYERVTSAHNR